MTSHFIQRLIPDGDGAILVVPDQLAAEIGMGMGDEVSINSRGQQIVIAIDKGTKREVEEKPKK